jgi:hypothetical protein
VRTRGANRRASERALPPESPARPLPGRGLGEALPMLGVLFVWTDPVQLSSNPIALPWPRRPGPGINQASPDHSVGCGDGTSG